MNILGVRIDAITMRDIIAWVRDGIQTHEQNQYIALVNVAKLIAARENRKLRRIIREADLVGVDGTPLLWYSKLLREPLPEKVSGLDIMTTMLRVGNEEGWSFYFLGATEHVVRLVVDRCRSEYPRVTIAGYRSGYFSPEDEQVLVEVIRKSDANILITGFGSPELFVDRWKRHFGVNIIHGVGGGFDVFAGLKARAPRWIQGLGLEWLYRLMQEPVRLFPRYATTNTKFVLLVLRDLLGKGNPPVDE